MKISNSLTLLAAALLTCGLANAQSAGTFSIRGGVTHLAPQVDSGTLSAPSPAGTKSSVSSDTQPTAGVTYMLTDNWALDVPLGLGFKHKIYGEGAISGVGQIGSVRALPITAFAQYRFMPAQNQFRPYIAVGGTYAKFYDAQGSAALSALNPLNPVGGQTGLSVDSKFGLSLGVGGVVKLTDKFFLEGSISKTFLKTRTTLSTGQGMDVKLDPIAVSLAVGMRF